MEIATIASVLLVLGLALTSAFFRLSAIIWATILGVTLLAVTFFGLMPIILLVICWFVYLIAATFANIAPLRQRLIVKPAMSQLKKKLPTISLTEREAIEAGNTWWEKELFSGTPDWDKLIAMPQPVLTVEEQAFLDNQVEHLCSMLNDWDIVFKEHNLPYQVWEYLKQERFFGMVIPKEYGGLGFSAFAHSTIVVKIATRSISAAVNTMVPNSLGPAELLLHYGTDEQKNHYLPRLATGKDIPCFALTAPDAGSDAGAIPDTGIVCKGRFDGKEVIGIRLNWDKRYITLAPVATVLGLAFHMYDPEHLLSDKEDIGITLCLIPTALQGVEIGTRHYPLQMAFMNGPTRGKDVFIPLDWIIGGPAMAGQGWRMLMECLSIGRSISLPALSTASGKMAYRNAGAYARLRRQFNTPLASFEGIEEALGYIAGFAYILEATRIMTVGAVDQHIKPSTASAIAKYHMTEMARISVSHAMDIHAGHMVQSGPRNYLANLYISTPISITVEGANILTRNLIIFGQGAIRCHPYLLKEIELISAPDSNVKALDKVLMLHIGFFISNFAKNVVYGLTGGLGIQVPGNNKQIKAKQRQLTRMSAALALLADTSLILLGGSLKRRERISARLGDMLSQLYLASAALKYFNSAPQSEDDINYLNWSLEYCLAKIQIACDELLGNFPYRWLGKLLRFIIFPWGRAYVAPSDASHQKILSAMLRPSELRDRLTRYCYFSDNKDDLTNRLDRALQVVPEMDALLKKLNGAVSRRVIPAWYNKMDRIRAAQQAGVLTAEEAQALSDFEILRSDIIQVNEFSFDLNKVIA